MMAQTIQISSKKCSWNDIFHILRALRQTKDNIFLAAAAAAYNDEWLITSHVLKLQMCIFLQPEYFTYLKILTAQTIYLSVDRFIHYD